MNAFLRRHVPRAYEIVVPIGVGRAVWGRSIERATPVKVLPADAAFLWLAMLFVLTFSDYLTRYWSIY